MQRRFLLSISAVLALLIACSPKSGDQENSWTNHLIHEKSPYLLQHAHNPVDWYPWGEEALKKAQAENKLLIISIGYSSCHWCHVMEKESFSDTSVSRIMNEHFVSIKVDREERPDIDNIYMTACQIASGEGCGWPLNAIALPDGKPVYAGTYYPKAEWMRLLEYFVNIHEREPEKLKGFAEQMTEGIQQNALSGLTGEKLEWTLEMLDSITGQFLDQIDLQDGGKKGAPKFPMPNNFEFLLQHHHLRRSNISGEAVDNTLHRMASGGIYDQIGGGFARYSTDADWHVPHFEKMLYDNAQLISLYAKAYSSTGDPRFAAIVRQTIDFVDRELSEQNGGFYSSIDADSEGEEGTFYVWTTEQVKSVLQDDEKYELAARIYDIRERGNWESGKNVLRLTSTVEDLAKGSGVSPEVMAANKAEIDRLLFTARASRIRPHTDDKVLTSWNALMLVACLDAYRALGDRVYLERALKNEAFLKNYMFREGGGLWRTHKDGESGINAFLEDYALTIAAYIELYETTFEEAYLFKARDLTEYTIEYFGDEDGFFRFTSKDDQALIAEPTEISDNVIPASNSVMAKNLYALGTLLFLPEWIDRSREMVTRVMPQIRESDYPSYYSNWLQLAYLMTLPYYEVAIVGNDAGVLNLEMQRHYLPNALFLGGKDEGSLELLKEKLQDGETFIYVCRNKVCKLPVREADQAIGLLTTER